MHVGERHGQLHQPVKDLRLRDVRLVVLDLRDPRLQVATLLTHDKENSDNNTI